MPRFFMDGFERETLTLLRVVAGLMLLQHAVQKLFGALGGKLVESFARNWYAGVLELVFGSLLVLGLATRFSAFILSGELAFAYFMVHAGKGLFPVVNRGELAVLYCFLFLYLSARGGGPWSLDALLAKRRGVPADLRGEPATAGE
jgi:putative oxidoreductase